MNVITYDGVSEKREDCVFIRGKYYHKTKHCFYYNGIYYSPFSRYLVLDHETGKRVHTSSATVSFGVVGRNAAGYKFGYFSSNIANNGSIYLPKEVTDAHITEAIAEKDKVINSSDGGLRSVDDSGIDGLVETPRETLRRGEIPRFVDSLDEVMPPSARRGGSGDGILSQLLASKTKSRIMKCMDVWPFLKDGFATSESSDVIAKEEDVKEYDKLFPGVKFGQKTARNSYSFNLAYNSEVMMDVFQKAYDKIVLPKKDLASMSALAKYLGDKTFGIEYESWDGRIPTFLTASAGLIPLRDGSLRHDNICGYEYASVVMSGEKGLLAIGSQCDLLRDFTLFNEKCSMHIHIGNIPKTKENLVNLYVGLQSIQESLYSLFPSCLQKTSNYKQKDYCSPLPKLASNVKDITENDIVYWLSDATEKFQQFGRPHPKDSSAQHKWNINSRYSIFNLNNFYYTDRGTIECRVSTPTFNAQKVIALLLINTMLVNDAIKGKFHSSVEGLISENMAGPEKEWMLDYVAFRKSTLCKWSTSGGNVAYYEKFTNDGETGTKGPLF